MRFPSPPRLSRQKVPAAVYQDGQWKLADSTLEGSYLVFSAPAQGQVLLLDGGAPFPWIAVAAAGGLAAVLGAWRIVKKTGKKAGQTQEKTTADV